jgi:hypothetical protein
MQKIPEISIKTNYKNLIIRILSTFDLAKVSIYDSVCLGVCCWNF